MIALERAIEEATGSFSSVGIASAKTDLEAELLAIGGPVGIVT
jgi:hypothetical protein